MGLEDMLFPRQTPDVFTTDQSIGQSHPWHDNNRNMFNFSTYKAVCQVVTLKGKNISKREASVRPVQPFFVWA